MASLELTCGPGSLLLWAWLYFLGGGAALTAALSGAIAHELGHLLVLSMYHVKLSRIRLTAAGPVLEYNGILPPGREALAAAAGPLFGVLFAVFCFLMETPYFRYAGMVSLLCSVFNLLPAYPLDGGRLTGLFLEASLPHAAARRCMMILGLLTGMGLTAASVLWHAPVIAAAGIFVVANAVKMR